MVTSMMAVQIPPTINRRPSEMPSTDPQAVHRNDPHAVVRIERRNGTCSRQLGHSCSMAPILALTEVCAESS